MVRETSVVFPPSPSHIRSAHKLPHRAPNPVTVYPHFTTTTFPTRTPELPRIFDIPPNFLKGAVGGKGPPPLYLQDYQAHRLPRIFERSPLSLKIDRTRHSTHDNVNDACSSTQNLGPLFPALSKVAQHWFLCEIGSPS